MTAKHESLSAGSAWHMECNIKAPVYFKLGGTEERRSTLPIFSELDVCNTSVEVLRGSPASEIVLGISLAMDWKVKG